MIYNTQSFGLNIPQSSLQFRKYDMLSEHSYTLAIFLSLRLYIEIVKTNTYLM